MAWNDKNDPWGNNSGEQGPPDLDDAFRKFKQQFGGLFGGGSRGSGGGGSRRFFSPKLGIYAVLLVAFVWFIFGWYQVDAQEEAVVFRLGKVQDLTKGPGLKWNPPFIDSVEKVNVTRVTSHQHEAQMLTEDENIVAVKLVVQYIVKDPTRFLVDIRNPPESLRHATESALRHVVGSSTMDAVITEGREILGSEVEERLQNYLDRYQTGIDVSTVNIDSVGPPPEVQNAFDDVQKAKEDEVKFRNQANAYAEQIIPEARGQAQQEIEVANAYRDEIIAHAEGEAERFLKLLAEYSQAKQVTKDRLYIEAMESVMKNTDKVMIDTEQGNNILYLPLDQIRRSASQSAAGSSLDAYTATPAGDNTTTQSRRTGR